MRFTVVRLNPPVSLINLIEHIECFSDRCPNRIASVDELSLVTNVLVEVIKQFLGNLDADLRHVFVFAEEYLQRVAQHTGLARKPQYARSIAINRTNHNPTVRTRVRANRD